MTDSPVPEDKAPTRPPRWQFVVDLIFTLYALIGRPGEIAARGVLSFLHADQMRDILRVTENIVRRTLFLDAIERGAPVAPVDAPPRKSALRVRIKPGAAAQASEDPARWSLSFRIIPPAAIVASGKRPASAPRPALEKAYTLPSWALWEKFHGERPGLTIIGGFSHRSLAASVLTPAPFRARDPLPIAKRFEALIRVVRNPERRIGALARRLFGPSGRARADRMLIAPPRSTFDLHGVWLETLGPDCAAAYQRAYCNTS